jgi:hypothetical protein
VPKSSDKSPPNPSAAPFSAESLPGKWLEHYKQQVDQYQQYSNAMLSLIGEQAAQQDFKSYVTKSAGLMFDLQYGLLQSCLGFGSGSTVKPAPVTAPSTKLEFDIDENSEGVDARPVPLPAAIPVSTLVASDLIHAAGPERIPATQVRLTTSIVAPTSFYVSLKDIGPIVRNWTAPAAGILTLTGTIAAAGVSVAEIVVRFRNVGC